MRSRKRLDVELVRRGLVESRSQAQALIEDGKVLTSGSVATNPSRLVHPGEPIIVQAAPPRFVSRGGEKLDAALVRFDIDVAGRCALDVGASTGGFTDCLLQRGATKVVALDVGHGQLHEKLRGDPRVEVRERTNVRHVVLGDLDAEPFTLVTVDVSFISLGIIAGVFLGELAAPGADVVVLVKPQFEAGRAEVSKGRGVVRDPQVWHNVLDDVLSTMTATGAATMGAMVSPLLGAEGNVEFLVWLRAHSVDGGGVDIGTLIEQAQVALGGSGNGHL